MPVCIFSRFLPNEGALQKIQTVVHTYLLVLQADNWYNQALDPETILLWKKDLKGNFLDRLGTFWWKKMLWSDFVLQYAPPLWSLNSIEKQLVLRLLWVTLLETWSLVTSWLVSENIRLTKLTNTDPVLHGTYLCPKT